MSKITITFDKRNHPKINGRKTTPHNDGNNGRHVYICDQYVLKVDDRGLFHDDLGMWKQVKRQDRKYFVPCLAQGTTPDGIRWSIQPYVELDFNVTDEARDTIENLCDKYGLSDIIAFYSEDPWNWAMNASTGQPIIFDYGLV